MKNVSSLNENAKMFVSNTWFTIPFLSSIITEFRAIFHRLKIVSSARPIFDYARITKKELLSLTLVCCRNLIMSLCDQLNTLRPFNLMIKSPVRNRLSISAAPPRTILLTWSTSPGCSPPTIVNPNPFAPFRKLTRSVSPCSFLASIVSLFSWSESL